MIVLMKRNHTNSQLHSVVDRIKKLGAKTNVVHGAEHVTISILGDTQKMSPKDFEGLDGVDFVTRISKPFKLASKESRPRDSVISISGLKIGQQNFIAMAGPCSIESEDQTLRIARAVKKAGATVLRGGAFKPRSSPYSFQGLGEEGLKIMQKAKAETGLLTISEAMDEEGLDLCYEYVDIIQIGARNMQNFSLMKKLGKLKKPILLKRGMSATIEEWLMAAEYILSGGNDQVMLCERGIRTFDRQYARNTLDLNVVPILKHLTHLPIIIDPSHGTGHRYLVAPMAKASLAAGADGVIVEVHDKPEEALSDGPQALLPEDFAQLMQEFEKMSSALGKHVQTEISELEDVA